MGWQIGRSGSAERPFRLNEGVDPHNLMPKHAKNYGERHAASDDPGRTAPPEVIVPGSPQDPHRECHIALGRLLDAAACFPDAYRAVQQALREVTGEQW